MNQASSKHMSDTRVLSGLHLVCTDVVSIGDAFLLPLCQLPELRHSAHLGLAFAKPWRVPKPPDNDSVYEEVAIERLRSEIDEDTEAEAELTAL
jgi:hypothetical protein